LAIGRKAIRRKWIFKIKFHADGSIDKHKAKLFVLGCGQKEGVNYKETFPPVVKMTTVRALLAIPAIKGCFTYQIDVSNAFLHGISMKRCICICHRTTPLQVASLLL